MFELKNLIQKDKSPEQIEAEKANPETKTEYHKQVMEVILERAEKILWENPNEGWSDLVEKILDAAVEVGAKPSAVQRKWVEETVQHWIDDIVNEIEVFKNLAHAHNALSGRDRKKEEEIDAQFEGNDKPWLLLEQNKDIQQALLFRLSTVNKDPEKFRIHSDHPPFIYIECLLEEDYAALYNVANAGEKDWKLTGGFASRGSLVREREDEKLGLAGLISVARFQSDEIRVHEEQHLFYGRYVANKKTQDLRAIDELAAYFKGGRYDFMPQGIFSDLKTGDINALQTAMNNPDWHRVINQISRMQYYGIPVQELWSVATTSENLGGFADRLAKVKVDPAKFDLERLKKGRCSTSWLLENYEQLPAEVRALMVPEKIEKEVEIDIDYFQFAELDQYLDEQSKEGALTPDGYDLDVIAGMWKPIIRMAEDFLKAFPDFRSKRNSRLGFGSKQEMFPVISVALVSRLQDCILVDYAVLEPLGIPEFSASDTWSETLIKIKKVGEVLNVCAKIKSKIFMLGWEHGVKQQRIASLSKKYLEVDGFAGMNLTKKKKVIEELYAMAESMSQK